MQSILVLAFISVAAAIGLACNSERGGATIAAVAAFVFFWLASR